MQSVQTASSGYCSEVLSEDRFPQIVQLFIWTVLMSSPDCLMRSLTIELSGARDI
jgi:hypothetical protein